MSSPDPLDFPPELCSKPTALVGLCGLDVTNNSLHRSIWELFSKTHERSPVNFKLFPLTHSFPPVKPKRTSYEWYIPKGLIKRNWMRKHLLEIPAAVAFLFDLNWDDPNWEQSKLTCVQQLQALRASLGNHATKIAVILIQRTAPLPAAEDVKAADRAKALCASCEIDTKQLFVLPHGDHLQGYIVRLENALYELAQNYYHQEIKLIKQHKDQLNKTTQQYLFVRHQFKVGFIFELKQDNHNARKHYDMAYTFLKEVRISDTNILEVKLIAGFLNYKLCYLMFRLNQPRDAIGQLRSHIDYYKSKTGLKELLFEHYSWLSKQYSAFGDIFDDAIRNGLSAVQTQHPGFYYQLAAQYSIDRKVSALELCKDVTVYPSSDPLAGQESLEFYGQRPWRPGKLSAEPTNPQMELEGITALKYKENLVNHSAIIVSLLGNAISQFKTYRCPRLRLQLVVQMADEYYYSKDYGKALTLLSHMLWDYRSEKWYLLLTTLLSRALCCAYLTASVQDYILFSLEALGPNTTFDINNKKRIFNNLMAVLKLKVPEPEPGILLPSAVTANGLWEAVNNGPNLSVPVEMGNLKSCVEAKARFIKRVFQLDELITVEVYIRCSCPQPLEFSHLSVVVTTPNYSSEFAVSSEKSTLLFEPGIVKKLLCEFKCDPSDAGKDIQIGSILMTIGTKERSAVLKFSGLSGSDTGTGEKPSEEYTKLKIIPPNVPEFEKIESLTSATIVPKDSKIKVHVKHDSPALLSEWYEIQVQINNDDNLALYHPSLEVKLQTSTEDLAIEQSTQLTDNLKTGQISSQLNLSLNDIPKSGNHVVNVYLRGHRIGERNIVIKLLYGASEEDPRSKISVVETLVKIPVIKPFEVSAEILSMKFEQIQKCYAYDSFILSPTIQILSPWPIIIHHTTLELGLIVKSCDKELTSHLAGTTLSEGEGGTDMFALRIEDSSEQPIALGTYLIKWSRAGSLEITSSSVTMPTVRCEPAIIGVEMTLPAHGWVRKPMSVEYRLCNYTSTLLQLDLVMDASDAFMFAGQKQVLLRLLPGSVRKLEYSLYPLFSGLVALPRLMLSAPEITDQLSQIIERNLPSHVYVMPQEKISPTAVGL